MAGSRPLLLAALLALALAVLAPGASAAPAPAPERSVRVVVLPLKLVGERVPPRPQLERRLRQLSAFWSRVSYGRLRVAGEVAPVFTTGFRRSRGNIIPHATLDAAVRSAMAHGIRMDGALPLFLAPARQDELSFANAEFGVIQGRGWSRLGLTVAHELAHLLGLDHASAPVACPRPFRPVTCAERPADVYEYGDLLDVMGLGADRLGAYGLAALGLAPVRDAPAGSATVAVHPLESPSPTLLRLRTAAHDWYVESRARAGTRDTPRPVRVPRSVAIARVVSRYAPNARNRMPKPLRVPAVSPATPCASTRSCVGRQLFRPGRTITVPGAFRLRVLGPGPAGSTRVRTTWLDRTPPVLSLAGATVVRRFAGGDELVAEVRVAAAGAGVAEVLIEQGGTVVRVDPDTVPGLVAGARGAGVVRAPLAPGAATARLRAVDAAGNASAPVDIALAALPRAAAATVGFDPALGQFEARATPLPGGRAVTVSGVTDPSFAGLAWELSVIGTQVSQTLLIGPGGAFSATWTPSEPGLYRVVAEVPVERIPGSIELRRQTFDGWVRA